MHGKFGLLSPGESEQPYYGATQLLFFVIVVFLCGVFSCFRNPPNSDNMDYRTLNVRT